MEFPWFPRVQELRGAADGDGAGGAVPHVDVAQPLHSAGLPREAGSLWTGSGAVEIWLK
jgi:hypothetical protein